MTRQNRSSQLQGARMRCAHCDTPGIIRASERVSEVHSDIWYQCQNVQCGHTWKAALSFVHTITQSAAPRAGLDLPKWAGKAANDAEPPANDNQPPGHVVGST